MAYLIGYYNYTVILTYAGLISAVSGIFLAMGGNTRAAVICLLFSGVCDMFDGKIARTKKNRTKEEKCFGIQIDSLCDIVCFGVLPAVIGLSLGSPGVLQAAAAAFFVLCGVIRLAYFNVTEEARQNVTDSRRSTYTGMPITTSALLVPLLMCFAKPLGGCLSAAYSALLLIMGMCFITPLNVKKPGTWGGIVLLCAGAVIFLVLVL